MLDSVTINCPVCGSSREVVLWDQKTYRMVRCRDCDLYYQSLRLSEQELIKRYQREHIIEKSAGREKPRWWDGHASADFSDIPEKFIVDYRNTLAAIEKHEKKGKLLEIGFGSGILLLVARDAGWNVTGTSSVAASMTQRSCRKERHPTYTKCGRDKRGLA
jgi:hypothetical protein